MPEEPKSVNDLPQAKDDIGDPEIAASQKEEDVEPIGPLASQISSQSSLQTEQETPPTPPETYTPETLSTSTQEPPPSNPETLGGISQPETTLPPTPDTTSEQSPLENQIPTTLGAEGELPRIPETNVSEIPEIPKGSEETTLPATPSQDSTTSLYSPQPEPSWPPIPATTQAQVFTQGNQEQPAAQISASPTPNKKVSIIFVILGLFIIGAAIVLGVLFYNRYQEQNIESTDSTSTPATSPTATEPNQPPPPTETGPSSVFGNLLNPGGQPSPTPPNQ